MRAAELSHAAEHEHSSMAGYTDTSLLKPLARALCMGLLPLLQSPPACATDASKITSSVEEEDAAAALRLLRLARNSDCCMPALDSLCLSLSPPPVYRPYL